MAMRIRVLAGCFALGVTTLLVTGTAAQATPQSGAHVSTSVSPTSSPTCSTCQTVHAADHADADV